MISQNNNKLRLTGVERPWFFIHRECGVTIGKWIAQSCNELSQTGICSCYRGKCQTEAHILARELQLNNSNLEWHKLSVNVPAQLQSTIHLRRRSQRRHAWVWSSRIKLRKGQKPYIGVGVYEPSTIAKDVNILRDSGFDLCVYYTLQIHLPFEWEGDSTSSRYFFRVPGCSREK